MTSRYPDKPRSFPGKQVKEGMDSRVQKPDADVAVRGPGIPPRGVRPTKNFQ